MRLEEEKENTTMKPQADDRLLKTRSIILSGEINKDSADKVIRDLLVLDSESKKPVKIYINSPGGDVDAGYAIYDMIRFVSSPVTLIGTGLVASAAALILLAVPAERRVGLPNSSYLIHQPLSKMRGNATEIEIHALQLEKIKAKINKVISDATGKSMAQVEKDTDRDHWLNAQEALEYGLISRVVERADQLGL
ncbi:MAG: ATP-dependent Clp protease proteolytic subunit [Spirochaetales bacterium]